MKESTSQAVKIIVWSIILFGLVLLLGGFKIIKRELMLLQCLYTEHKMLSYIGITQAERMPADLIEATLTEKPVIRLTFSPDGTPIWDASPATENTERLKQFILNLLPESPMSKANALGTGIFLATEEYESSGYTHKSVRLIILNPYWMATKKGEFPNIWRYWLTYNPNETMHNYLGRETELTRFGISNDGDKISVGYNTDFNLPTQYISIKDYEAYMQARAAGKVSFLDPISAINILEFLGITPNREVHVYATQMPVRYETADPLPTATP